MTLLSLVGALAPGAGFIVRAVRFAKGERIGGARSLYLFSLLYLAVLFGALATDSLV